MRWSGFLGIGILPGTLAGLAGGLVYGAIMSELNLLRPFSQLVQADSAVVGFILLTTSGAIIGPGFGILVWHQRPGPGETLFWGLVYGTFWWYLGQLTMLPLLQGEGLSWDLESAQAAFPNLLGHMMYGATTGLALVFLQWKRHVQDEAMRIRGGALLRGALAGLLSAWLLGSVLSAQGQLQASMTMAADNPRSIAWLVTMLVGLLSGVGFALLYPHPTGGAGTGLIRGAVYGLFWWVVGALTLVPFFSGSGLRWSLASVQANFATLPGYILFGAAVALFYQWLSALINLLFSDFIIGSDEEGVGTQGLRVVGRSVLAGLIGGLIFSIVMLQIGFLPKVADLVGATSSVAGFFVHLAIAVLIGTSYCVLFRRQSYDLSSALGWGVSYGFFWSILGPLTLMPVFLWSTPQWTVEAMVAAFPNLIGHRAYGAVLGITFYLLEARYNPWWVPRTRVEDARVAHRKEQVLTSAPALWTVLVAAGLTLPIMLGGPLDP